MMYRVVLLLGYLSGPLIGVPEGEDPLHAVPGVGESPEVPMESPASEFDVLSESLLREYFAAKPDHFLIDPQRVLGSAQSKARLTFLNYHSGDSQIDLYAFVFKEKQELPEARKVEAFMASHLQEGRPAVLAMYPYGAPGRARLFLTRALQEVVPAQEQRRALASAIQQAQEESDANTQLEVFLIQTSMRLFWMERALGVKSGGEEFAPVVNTGEEPSTEWRLTLKEQMNLRASAAVPWLGQLAGAAAVILFGCVFLVLSRIRARYEFPDFSVEPRMGGAHGAGMGAVISFSNRSSSPASQRDPGRDLLGKL